MGVDIEPDDPVQPVEVIVPLRYTRKSDTPNCGVQRVGGFPAVKTAFWISFGFIAYVYAVYPIAIWAASRLRPWASRTPPPRPLRNATRARQRLHRSSKRSRSTAT